jgi:glycosyltransferase involved in cell wall biosynthesis
MQTAEHTSNLPQSTTVIIPAYNEEKRIGKVLEETTDFVCVNNLNWRIIVAVDGNDGTDTIVKSYAAEHPFVSLNKKGGRSGKGEAIRRATMEVTEDITIVMDADGSIDLGDVIENLRYIESFDMVIFDRYSNSENRIPLYRKIPSRGYNLLVKSIFGIKFNDTQCGYFIFRSDIGKKAFNRIKITNGFFYVPLLYYVSKLGGKIKEIPIKYVYDGKSKFKVSGMVIGGGVSLFAFRLRHSRFYKYIPQWAIDLYLRKFRWI